MTKWRKIRTAPKDGRRVLLHDGHGTYVGSWGYTSWGGGWRCDTWFSGSYNVGMTHWMPLPKAPA